MKSRLGLTAVMLIVVLAHCARVPRPERPPPAPPPVAVEPTPALLDFRATAYSIAGETASGSRARKGIVAADPRVLPLGSRIRVHGAGRYSGEYHVADTGPAVRGREIDIYIPERSEAVRFGRRSVRVEVLEYGDGRN